MSATDEDLRFHGDQVAAPRPARLCRQRDVRRPTRVAASGAGGGPGAGRGYPDERPATAALAARHGRPPGEVVPLNGAAEAFWLLAQALRPKLPVVVQPSFTEPEAALRSGRGLHGAHRRDRHLADRGHLPGLVVVRSLTKLSGLAGIRAGYLLAPFTIASALRAVRQPWSVNSLACAALAAWARQPTDHAAHQVHWLAANFLLLQVPNGPGVRQGLAARGIAMRPCDSFPGLTADHLRVAVRDPADNQRLLDTLGDILGCQEETANVRVAGRPA